MENRNGSLTELEMVISCLPEKATMLLYTGLILKLLKREVYVPDIYHEYSHQEWEVVSEALEKINTEDSLRIKNAVDYFLAHTN